MRSLRPFVLGVLAVVVVLFLAGLIDPWNLISNPFRQERVDRSGPALLERLEDLSEYRAASAQLQELIDIEDDTRFVPSFISGQRVSFLAHGSVEAIVDFSGLDADAVMVSEDRETVRITLPRARLGQVRIDPDESRVLNRERGVLDRLGSVFSDNPTSERELYQLAEEKLRDAAADSELTARAETNTRRMLRALLGTLGFEDITISFEADART